MKRYRGTIVWTCVLVVFCGTVCCIRDGSLRNITGYLLAAGILAALSGSGLSRITNHSGLMNQLNGNMAYEADRLDRQPHTMSASLGTAGLTVILLALVCGYILR